MKKTFFFYFLMILAVSCKNFQPIDVALDKNLSTDVDYYSADFKAWIRFTELKPDLKGYFFVDSGRAEVCRMPFIIKTEDEVTRVYYKTDRTDTRKIRLGSTESGTIRVGWDDKSYTLVREKREEIPDIPARYRMPVTDKLKVTTLRYGQARGYYTSKKVDKISEDKYPEIIAEVGKELISNFLMSDLPLELDLYRPAVDSCKKRPLLVLLHGGAFMLGDKTNPTMKSLAEHFAQHGYVVASVNYRLGFWFVPGSYYFLERAIYRATQDSRAAIRFLVTHADEYGIDTSLIYTAGNSAGGFLALNTAMMNDDSYFPSRKSSVKYLLDDLGCLDCSSNNLKERFRIRAVINMWGALTHIRMLVENPRLPVLCFHGDADELIPLGHDYPFANVSREFSSFFTEKVFGSEAIYKYAKVTHSPVQLKLFHGGGHDPHIGDDESFNAFFDTLKTLSVEFLAPFASPRKPVMKGPLQFRAADSAPEYVLGTQSDYQVFWEVSGGKILPGSKGRHARRVIWFQGEKKEISIVLRNRNHASALYTYPVSLRP